MSHHRSPPARPRVRLPPRGSCVESPDGELVVNLWPSEYGAPLDVGACGCPASCDHAHACRIHTGSATTTLSLTMPVARAAAGARRTPRLVPGADKHSGNMCSDERPQTWARCRHRPTTSSRSPSPSIKMRFSDRRQVYYPSGRQGRGERKLRYPGLWNARSLGSRIVYLARSNESMWRATPMQHATTVFTAGESYEIRLTNIDSLLRV